MTEIPDEEQIFAWLNRKYVQRADERQRSMNLQYMEAETHDLSVSLHRWLTERTKNCAKCFK